MTEDVYTWYDENGVQKSLKVLGHNLLVRKCRRNADELLIEGATKPVEGLPPYLLQAADAHLSVLTERSNFCEVLAVGSACGTSYHWAERRKLKLPCLGNPVRVGDFVVLPEVSKHERMWNDATGALCDIIVDECEVLVLIPMSSVPEEVA